MSIDNNNNILFTYQTNIRGVSIGFTSSKKIDIKQLNQYVELGITSQIGSIHSFQDVLHRLSHHQTPSTELSNSIFTEFMSIIDTLFHSYQNISSAERQPVLEPAKELMDSSSPEIITITNVSFKEKTKETAFDRYWKQHYDQLVDFKLKFGHSNVSRTTPGYAQLGNWLTDQRRKYRKGKLTKEQFDMLSSLGRCVKIVITDTTRC